MRMTVSELHPSMVHAPLALLPTAALVDFAAALTRQRGVDRVGRALWWAGAGSGLLAGLAGMAASQEVKAEDDKSSDMIWVHGIGNLVLVLGAIGIATWRSSHRASVGVAVGGLVASAASMYTAYLGGEMVYSQGIGVRSMPRAATTGVRDETPLLSRQAPKVLLRDAVRGLTWLLERTSQVLSGKKQVDRRALGFGGPPGDERRPNGTAA